MKNHFSLLMMLLAISGCATHNNPPNTPTLQLTSMFPAKQVVDCILANYKGAGFVADGFFTADGSIAVNLEAPKSATLALVSDRPGGSTTQYLNFQYVKDKDIPHQDIFDNAVNKCQSSP